MKIVMFGQKQTFSRRGGVEVVVEELSTRMAALGHSVVCYDRSGPGRRRHRGVELRQVPAVRRKGLEAVSSSFCAAVCSAFGDADVVHIHGEGPAFWCWIPKLRGKRIVVTVHGLDWQREKWKGSFGKVFIRLGERAAARFADEVIVLSRNVQGYFRTVYGRDTVWIPNGAAQTEGMAAREISRAFGLKRDGYVLYLGRLVPEKGIHHLIEAWKGVQTDKTLVIAGAASDTDTYAAGLRKQAEGNGRILFTGFVQGQIREELYSNAWVYVLPSELEGMPLSLLEAMSHGCCCLVSDIPECTEVGEDKALQFPKGNSIALQETLQMLLDTPELVQEYREKARRHVCERFRWDETVKKTLELYQ